MKKSQLDLSYSGDSNKSPRQKKEKRKRTSRKIPHDAYEISRNLLDNIIENSMYVCKLKELNKIIKPLSVKVSFI